MKKVMIDTNIYSLAMKGDPEVVDVLQRIEQIGISAVSIGELFSVFRAGSRLIQQAPVVFAALCAGVKGDNALSV